MTAPWDRRRRRAGVSLRDDPIENAAREIGRYTDAPMRASPLGAHARWQSLPGLTGLLPLVRVGGRGRLGGDLAAIGWLHAMGEFNLEFKQLIG